MRKFLFFVLFLVFTTSITFAQVPTLQKYVNDYANVLSSSDIARINALAAEIEENTTVQIAVLTVDTTEPLTIEEYAVEVFEKAGIGYEDKDNGLLIVAAINDRKWRIEIGYGLEPIINDAKAGLIGRTYLVPAFQEGKYGDGLYDAVSAIYLVIQKSGDTSFISEQMDDDILFILPLILVLIPLFIIIVILISTPRCPKCGARMKCQYKRDYMICECPKCGKKVKKKRKRAPFWFFFFVGSRGHGGGGGYGGGFGGGSSGGGGASGGW